MSKITVEGYVINVDNGEIDFSAVSNFDPARIEYISNAKTGVFYYVRPRPPIDWGTWNGVIFTPKGAPWGGVGPVPKLICLSNPPPAPG